MTYKGFIVLMLGTAIAGLLFWAILKQFEDLYCYLNPCIQ